MNIYVSESVSEVVDGLRAQEIPGINVDYTSEPEDPENPNGYVVLKNKPYDIIAVVSSVIRWRKVQPDWGHPKQAKACIQILSLARKMELEGSIREKAKNLFFFIKED